MLALKNDEGSWVYDLEVIKSITREFLMSLYHEEFFSSIFPLHGCFPSVTDADWEFVYKDLTREEIKDTMFSMGRLKALSLDGLHALFFPRVSGMLWGNLFMSWCLKFSIILIK